MWRAVRLLRLDDSTELAEVRFDFREKPPPRVNVRQKQRQQACRTPHQNPQTRERPVLLVMNFQSNSNDELLAVSTECWKCPVSIPLAFGETHQNVIFGDENGLKAFWQRSNPRC
jgi:hypothetical protein